MRLLFVPLAAAFTMTVVDTAHAADPTAESLFTTAVTALDAGDFATACPLFEQSYARNPALGTAYNLALCAEHAGKKVDALDQFRAVQAKALAAGRKKTEGDAREHADALEKTLGHVRVRTAPRERGQIAIDGRAPTDATDEIVEPGEHVVELARDGRPTFRATVTVVAGQSTEVDLPAETSIETTRDSPMPWRTVGIGAAAVGLVGIGVGAGFGIAAQSSRDSARSACGSGGIQTCQASGVSSATLAWNDAKSDASVSTAFVVAGAVLLAGGAVLYLVAPKSARAVGFASDPRPAVLGGRW